MFDAERQPTPDGADPSLGIAVEAAECFNYAAWQNSVPILRSVSIANNTSDELSDVSVELRTSPAFARAKCWTIDRIGPNQTFPLHQIDLEIDADFLDRLDEAVRGILTFRLVRREKVLAETTHSLRVLARDEWGGMATMGPLLAAFVTPNDPSLAPVLKAAADVLGRHGHPTGLDGYQSHDPNRAFLLTAAMWSAVASRSITYANPPSSFEQVGQKTRRVATVLADGLATCMDTTLLFASGLEAIGLHPVIVMTQGHCFAGAWLVEKTLKKLVEPDCSELRKAVAAKELVVFETTLATQKPAAEFIQAIGAAQAALAEPREHEFVAAVDVARARMAQIRPLASHAERPTGPAVDGEAVTPELPSAPGFERVPAEEVEERPDTPAGRIERWQRKLLDLSLRNRLLNFRPTKQTVPVLCPDVSRLEDRLANGGRLRLTSLKEQNSVANRDPSLHQQRTLQDLDLEFARQALERDEVVCPVEPRELDARLTTLFRKVKNDLAEGGANTLYLAVGFLRWKQSPTDEKSYRAPLLLAPIKLTRRSASSPFYLTNHEDEVRFNATLLQLLKKDFDCDLTAMESNLPTDDSGVDVPRVLERMRRAVRDIPGFEVVEEAAIASFSFAKHLMWKDLVERVGQLEHNRFVRHLVHEPDKPFEVDGAGPMPEPHQIDVRYQPADIVHPLPADSSQLAAVMAASEGHDLVIVGPPGTGKSQTIANLIAQCLAVGKTVLFVAEKTAALDVVYRRLRQHGLGDCCVELHSNKAERRRFLDQLEASWSNRVRPDGREWLEISERLRIRRDELNAYVAAVHGEHANGWTAYRAMGICVQGRDLEAPRLPWPAVARHDRAGRQQLQSAVERLARAFSAVRDHSALKRVQAAEWSMAWENDLLENCRRLKEAAGALAPALELLTGMLRLSTSKEATSPQLSALFRLARELTIVELPPEELVLCGRLDALQQALAARTVLLKRRTVADESLQTALQNFSRALGASPEDAASEDRKRSLYRLANELVRSELPPAELAFHQQFAALPGLADERPALLEVLEQACLAVETRGYGRALLERIPVASLEQAWAKACGLIWPLSAWRKTGVRRRLKSYMASSSIPDPDIDLPLLREYVDNRDRAAENLASLGLPSHLRAAIEQDVAALADPLKASQRLRDALVAAGLTPDAVAAACHGNLAALTAAARPLYPPAKDLEKIRAELKENLSSLGLPSRFQAVVNDDAAALNAPLESARRLQNAVRAVCLSDEAMRDAIRSILGTPGDLLQRAADDFCRTAKSFQGVWQSYSRLAETAPAAPDTTSVVDDAKSNAEQVLANRTLLKQWVAWVAARRDAYALDLRVFVEAIESGDLTAPLATERFDLAYARWWLPIVVDGAQPLRNFQRVRQEDAILDFRRLDDLARQAAATRARQAVFHDLPPSDQVPRRSELGLLRHQMGLKRPSKSIREIISAMPESFGRLTPCLLMSPLSIAQYLPAEQAHFDVVVFDEASQIATWDAIGAIARGRQTIIVGDPKQLPPTNFFGRADSDEENDELEDFDKDLESVLDEARASGVPTLQLNWHYRSRHESLIAFSNWNYYGNRLVTFPAAESLDRGVTLTHIAGALYDRGKSRTNRQEAEAIVVDAVARMKRCLARAEEKRLTYGVVTFNSQQQTLIQDLFDQALRDSPELEWYFADERVEPTAVKNLENVQGDERDVMYFSITFGKDAAGRFPIDFGAINREGGERRLNVAVTRARQALFVYSSFLPDELRAERSSARGVRDLKAFLEYAHRGAVALAGRIDGSVGECESPLEETVAAALTDRGWHVEPQIGVSGFRVDLGVIHPDRPGAYLAGVECDGAAYHRAAAARDRDKTRQQVLENLGWRILRVWSPDWWYDPDSAIAALHRQLTEELDRSRAQIDDSEQDLAVASLNATEPVNFIENAGQPLDLYDIDADEVGELENYPRQLVTHNAADASLIYYRPAELQNVYERQSRFFDDDYSDELREMARAVLVAEAPIRDDVLARRVARAHGFGRTGARIKDRVLALLPDVSTTEEPAGRFLWTVDSLPASINFRYPLPQGERRVLDEVPMAELVGLVKSRPDLAASDDPALAFAREIGLARLAQAARNRLEAAIEQVGEN